MDRHEWLERVAAIKQWAHDGRRAPHKPLLLLAAIGELQRTGSSALRFADAEERLKRLLTEFGPPGTGATPQYPFVRLQNDGLWQVDTEDGSTATENLGQLRSSGATGRLAPDFEAALVADSALGSLVARLLLDREWEDSLHEDICAAVGLDLDALEIDAVRQRVTELDPARPRRDPAFRQSVLVAYEYRCAMCGYDGLLGGEAVALEAAHVRWWSHQGPDTVDNGLCLCSLHHKLLDRGVIGVSDSYEVTVSRQFVARSEAGKRFVLDLVGRPLGEPQAGESLPERAHVAWHTDQVFKGPTRLAAG
ncbi:MAG: HNH endonuclease [Acidimicrobiales bacterium]|nr:HNH endonuclease [Acidimicrobiales bacterium]